MSSAAPRRGFIVQTKPRRCQRAAPDVGDTRGLPYGMKRGFRWVTLPEDISALSGRGPAGDGGQNPSSRRAVCERHKYGYMRGAPGDWGAYSARAGRPQAPKEQGSPMAERIFSMVSSVAIVAMRRRGVLQRGQIVSFSKVLF